MGSTLHSQYDMQRELLARIRAVPGVDAAAGASVIPVSGSSSGNRIWIEGTTTEVGTNINRVSPGYFETMDISILARAPSSPRCARPLMNIISPQLPAESHGASSSQGSF
jgi:hypothetical protein